MIRFASASATTSAIASLSMCNVLVSRETYAGADPDRKTGSHDRARPDQQPATSSFRSIGRISQANGSIRLIAVIRFP
jgi:hypothetical protein